MDDLGLRRSGLRVFGLAMGVVLIAAACSREQATRVTRVEIRDYRGEKLGSLDDFRENSIKGPQTVDSATYRLVVDGLVLQSTAYTLQQLAALPRREKVVTLICVEGWRVKVLWEGISVSRLLANAQPLATANTVIFHAADGFTSSLPLATILERDLIVADKINGVVLPPERGFPLQVVAEDKLGYKWVKWLVRIELSDDPLYRGTYESMGYPNDADVTPAREPSRSLPDLPSGDSPPRTDI
jgi:DMSO/TMAO reductase YedYZ molybdopterin-dependent catalytic subunit